MSRFPVFAFFLTNLIVLAAPASKEIKLQNSFEPNRGQTSAEVKYVARIGEHPIFLTDREVVVTGKSLPLRIEMLGSNPAPVVTPADEVPGVTNYMIGKDETKWTLGLPHYARVRYQQVYSGVDMVYYFNGSDLEHDFVLAPNADWRQIRFRVNGATRLHLGENGDLLIDSPAGTLTQRKPVVYQGSPANKIEGQYVLRGDREFSFEIGGYDHSKALVIDPVTVFSTYVSGNGNDQPNSLATDSQGNSYVAGTTTSTDFPAKGGVQTKYGGVRDAFVTKLDGNTGAVVYSTYFGGSDKELATIIKVDTSGNAFVAGSTHSPDFPTTNRAFQGALKGQSAAFVVKLNAAGNAFLYSTLIGGSSGATARGLDIDAQGNAFIVGATNSSDFPVKGTGFGSFRLGGVDAFITKLSPDGSSLVFSGYVGGKKTDVLESVAVNSFGEATAVGWTNSSDLPTSPFDSRWPTLAGAINGWMVKFSPNGFTIEYISYYGGSNIDVATSVSVDPTDPYTVYIGGFLSSPDFPTALGDGIDVSAGQAIPYAAKFALPGGPGFLNSLAKGNAKPRQENKVDDYDWLKFWKDPCPAPDGPDYSDQIIILQKNIDDYQLIEEMILPFIAAAAFGLTTIASTVAGAIVTVVIVIKHILEPAKCKAGAFAFLRSVTVVSGFIYALNSADGNLIELPQPPLGTGGQTTIRGIATDPSGSLHMLLQTSDAGLPVSSGGAKLASGLNGAYVMKMTGSSSGPSITSVTNAFGGSATIAPNTWVAIKGSSLAPAGDSRVWQGADFVGNQLPVALDGVSVKMNGISAYVYYISSGQLNVLTPPNLPAGPVQVTVAVNGTTSSAFTVQSAAMSPSLFVFGPSGDVVGTHLSGGDLGPTSLFPNLTTPAKPGETVVIYGNGFGSTSTPVIAGSVTQSGTISLPTFQIGGAYAPCQFAGLISPGLYQFNVQVPDGLPSGENAVMVTYNGATTQSGVVLAVQP